MNWRTRNLDFTILRFHSVQMKPFSKIKLKNYLPLIFGLLFLLGCTKDKDPEIRMNGLAYVQKIPSFEEPVPQLCSEFSEKILVPSSLSANKKLSDGTYFEYCIQFSGDILLDKINRTAMSLGYIDNFPMVYLNGEKIYSYENENPQEIYKYEKELIFEFNRFLIKKDNILIVRLKPIFLRENGMGIFGGILRISSIDQLAKWNNRYKIYNFGKVVLYFGTSLLFVTLFWGRRREYSFLYFGIFLFIVGLYFSTKLELKYDLGLNLYLLKKLEYISLSMLVPSLNFFLPAILHRKLPTWLLIYNLFVTLLFSGVFFFLKELKFIDEINHIYHVPFILLSLILSLVIIISEIREKNKRAIPILLIIIIPYSMSMFHILNSAFLIFPSVMNVSIGGDSIFILVVCMTIYVAIGFYKLQKNLDITNRKEESLRRTFQLYVPPKDLEKILKSYDSNFKINDIGEVQKIIILFCDIREFTTISEKMSPNELVQFLNSYFTYFNSIIIEKGGVIDKLIGDCIMARFDSHLEKEAVETALLLQAHIKRFNGDRKKKRLKPISHGVGLSMGDVVVGNIGSVNKMDFTVIGDAVNLASRLESLTKFYGVEILITENLYRTTKQYFYYREIDKIRVKGKKRASRIFQPISPK
jgi:class 3 adenylate cyclase